MFVYVDPIAPSNNIGVISHGVEGISVNIGIISTFGFLIEDTSCMVGLACNGMCFREGDTWLVGWVVRIGDTGGAYIYTIALIEPVSGIFDMRCVVLFLLYIGIKHGRVRGINGEVVCLMHDMYS